jgi:hypothetical protein
MFPVQARQLWLDTETGAFSLSLKYITGKVGAMHIDHGEPGSNGKIAALLAGSKSVTCGDGTWCRDILITDGFVVPLKNISAMIAGEDYIVVFGKTPVPESSPDGQGAIRGQLKLVQ